MNEKGGGRAGAPALLSSRYAPLIVVAVAFLALLPELIAGLSLSDSFVFNLGWGEQFRDLVRTGHPWPRWMPRAWEGAGTPAFYFYPPFFFWAVAIVDFATLQLLPIQTTLSLASAAVLAASGLAMRAWLRGHAENRIATIGALAYMLTPYRLFDLYSRGALAELCAYLFVPLILIGIRRLAKDRPGGLPLLAASYAGLALSHLPLALLASLSLVPAYILFACFRLAEPRPRFLLLAATGGLLGSGVAAAYVLPALHLLDHTSAEGLVGPYFRPEAWFVWRLADWPSPIVPWIVLPVCLAALLLAGLSARDEGDGRFWAGLTAVLILLALGILPWFWQLPFLAQVQFPWRLIVLVDFTLVTSIVVARPDLRSLGAKLAYAPLAVAAGTALLLVFHHAGDAFRRFPGEAASVRDGYRSAPEYLPSGTRLPLDERGRPLPIAIAPPSMPLARADNPQARLQAEPSEDGGLRVAIDSAVPTRLTVRRFYFPHWSLIDEAGAPIRLERAGLGVSWRAPAGTNVYTLRPGRAPLEQQSLAVSLVSAILVLALVLAPLIRPRKP